MSGINWTDFILGGVTVMFAYALFSAQREPEEELEEESSNVVVTDFSRKLHQLSCQTCRKIKNHREVEPRVFECCKCKRRTNLKLG